MKLEVFSLLPFLESSENTMSTGGSFFVAVSYIFRRCHVYKEVWQTLRGPMSAFTS